MADNGFEMVNGGAGENMEEDRQPSTPEEAASDADSASDFLLTKVRVATECPPT